MNHTLLKYGAKDYFFKATLCSLCIDLLAGTEAMEKYEDMFPQFAEARECKLLKVNQLMLLCVMITWNSSRNKQYRGENVKINVLGIHTKKFLYNHGYWIYVKILLGPKRKSAFEKIYTVFFAQQSKRTVIFTSEGDYIYHTISVAIGLEFEPREQAYEPTSTIPQSHPVALVALLAWARVNGYDTIVGHVKVVLVHCIAWTSPGWKMIFPFCTTLKGKRSWKGSAAKNINFFFQTLMEALKEEDVDTFTDAVKDYDSISRLDQWTTTMLLRVKKTMGEDDSAR